MQVSLAPSLIAMLGALVDDFVAATWTCLHAALDLRGGLSGPVTWRFSQGVAGDPEVVLSLTSAS